MPVKARVPACRQGDNTLDLRIVPVVFVPGVMGSRLQLPNSGKVWDPDSPVTMVKQWMFTSHPTAAWQLCSTQPAQVMTTPNSRSFPPEDKKGRGWEGVAESSYGEFLKALDNTSFRSAICPVYAVGYDWRQSNSVSGKYVANKIRRDILPRHPGAKIILITHSMGGLVVRSALKQSSPLASATAGVIHGVQPVAGAVAAYRRFFTGMLGPEDGGWAFSHLLGLTPEKWAIMLSGLPGPTQLLPTNDYAATMPGWLAWSNKEGRTHIQGDVFDAYQNSHSPPGLVEELRYTSRQRGFLNQLVNEDVFHDLQARLDQARKFHADLGLYHLEGRTWAFYGAGVETDVALTFDGTDPRLEKYHGARMHREPAGDETVPAASGARLFGPGKTVRANGPATFVDVTNEDVRQFEVPGIHHEPAFRDGTVQTIVRGLIEGIVRQV